MSIICFKTPVCFKMRQEVGRIDEIKEAKCLLLMKFDTLSKIKILVKAVKTFYLVPADNRGKS